MNRKRVQAAVAAAALAAAVAAISASGVTAAPQAPPKNTDKPTISGTARDGETLTATNGRWDGDPTSFSYQWIRCNANLGDCDNVSGATNNTYRLDDDDVGRRLIVRVTARNADGSESADSEATPVVAERGNAPANTAPPTISGQARESETLTAGPGTWSGTQPITLTYQWQRCNANGGGCTRIPGATTNTYKLVTADVGRTIRVAVTAANQTGQATATSVPTAAVTQAGPAGQIRLSNGLTSIPAGSVSLPERLLIDQVSFSPNPVRSRDTIITAGFRVRDTRGFVVRDALVFVRSTPLVTTTPGEVRTGQDGTVTVQMRPEADFPLRRGYNVQFFVRVRKEGGNLLAGVSSRRLVQVRVAPASS